MKRIFAGSYVALPTPFQGSGVIDFEALRRLVDRQAAGGSAGIVVCGTTGESATLTDRERRAVVEAAVQYAGGRLKVVAGVGTNATASSVELAQHAMACGADGMLVVTPYYNRPGKVGLLRHMSAVAEAGALLPVMLYNVPTRTACDLLPEWAGELARECPNVLALKEATSDPRRIREVCAIEELEILCGEDGAIVEFMAAGAVGAVNVVGNVFPELVDQLIETASQSRGDSGHCRELREALAPLVRDLFIETNPGPVKAALASLDVCESTVRGPLAAIEQENLLRVEGSLRKVEDLGLAAKMVAVLPTTSSS